MVFYLQPSDLVEPLMTQRLQELMKSEGQWAESFTHIVFFFFWSRSEDPPPQKPCPRDGGAGQPFTGLAGFGGKSALCSHKGLEDIATLMLITYNTT